VNVLHLIESSEPGGAEAVLLSIAKGLRDKGHTSVAGLLQPGWLHDELKQCGIPTVLVDQRRAYDLGCLRTLSRLVRRLQIDIIHSHEFMMNVYGSLAGSYEGVPVISTVHGKNYYPLRRRRRLAYRIIVSRLSTMVAICEDMKRFLTARIGIPKDSILTVHNGIDSRPFERAAGEAAVAATKRELSIPADSPVVGTVGMLVPEKDHSTFLKAAQLVVRQWPGAIFLVIGSGRLQDSLMAEASRAGIENRVRFAGFRSDIAALLHAMDVYVCSSVSEGLSLSILEAMAAAKPVVATDVGGNPELVVDDATGFVVPARDPSRLAERITFLLEHDELARELGRNGQRRVEQRFTLGHMVDSYEALYYAALARGRKRRGAVISALSRVGSADD
jgi:glycosyltransferase involved in cell wall biosynthesis